ATASNSTPTLKARKPTICGAAMRPWLLLKYFSNAVPDSADIASVAVAYQLRAPKAKLEMATSTPPNVTSTAPKLAQTAPRARTSRQTATAKAAEATPKPKL